MNHLQLVQGQLDAYNEFNLQKFCSFYHKDVVVRLLPSDEVVVSGIEAFRSDYEELFKKFPNQRCELRSRIVRGETIVDEEMVFGRPNQPEGKHAVAIYAFADGLINRVWFLI